MIQGVYNIKVIKKYLAVLIFCCIFFVAPFFCSAAGMEKIFYMSQGKEKEGIVSINKNAGKIDILAPQFFAVNAKMKIAGSLDANLKKVIAQKNFKVMPLLVNAGFSQGLMHKLLTSPADQDAVAQGLVYIAKKNNYIGWQFDFENISYLDKDLYSAFVEKTATALHKNGLIMSVAAVTRTCDYEDTDAYRNWGGAFDYARLAKATDFISLMTYDDPNSVGPVASLPFINKVLVYVKDKIPPEKLSLGIPLYYWGWDVAASKKVTASGTFSKLFGIMSNYVHTLGFDKNLGVAWLSYSNNNKKYNIWYEDEKTFSGKLGVITQNNFRGFSAWVLGIEDPAIWSVLAPVKK